MSDRLIRELELIRESMYRDQPDTFGAVNSIINLLQYHFCEHDWERRRAGGAPDDPGSNEMVHVCRKCGAEMLK